MGIATTFDARMDALDQVSASRYLAEAATIAVVELETVSNLFLDLIQAARRRGVESGAGVAPYPRTVSRR